MLRRLEALEEVVAPPVLVWREEGQTAEQAIAAHFEDCPRGRGQVYVLCWADNPPDGSPPEWMRAPTFIPPPR